MLILIIAYKKSVLVELLILRLEYCSGDELDVIHVGGSSDFLSNTSLVPTPAVPSVSSGGVRECLSPAAVYHFDFSVSLCVLVRAHRQIGNSVFSCSLKGVWRPRIAFVITSRCLWEALL